MTIALEPSCRFCVKMRDGERAVAFSQGRSPRAIRIDGTGEDEIRSGCNEGVLLSVAEAGKYSISIPAIPGFAQAEPIIVEARKREVVDVVFQLVR